MVSEIEEPFEIHSNTFEQTTYNNATLYVPKGSKYKYKTTDNWNKFNKIISEGSYKLSYVVDGEEYQTKNVEEAEAITPIDEPTKEGYTFSGWNGVPEIMPANDVIVTGTFTINKYKVTYIVDGAEYKTTEVEYGSTLTSEAEPTKEGYSFSGWSDIPETMPANDVTITGTFNVNKYKLTYMVDGEEYKSSEVDYGTAITAEAVPTKEGYTFSGWSGLPTTMPANDVTVTGTFTVNKFTITYVVDGVTLKTEEVEYGTTITPPTSQKDGYEISWNAHPTTMPAYGITIYGSYISTGIENNNRETTTDNRYFNLNGQRIEGLPSQKGVYIKNGKKVMMK